MKKILVCGAGGFIGSHLVKKLKSEGHRVIGVDLKKPEFSKSPADFFALMDLRNLNEVHSIMNTSFDEIYQLAADMGGAGYIFSGVHDADVMHNSALINLNIVQRAIETGVGKLFFSSSACMYPQQNQLNTTNPNCAEHTAYPANPDSEYGWEKVFSERLYLAYHRNYGLDVRIARFHNIYGPEGSYNNGKEKAPAAMCRKIAEAKWGDTIEIWGDGKQTRSFLFIDECLTGITTLMNFPNAIEPINIGSDEMVSINMLALMVAQIAGKHINLKHIDGPTGVRGRCSDNKLIKEKLGWAPNYKLIDGIEKTYPWINIQINGK